MGRRHERGIREVFADGSFVEEKDHPNDIDGYFVCGLADLASGELPRKLNYSTPAYERLQRGEF